MKLRNLQRRILDWVAVESNPTDANSIAAALGSTPDSVINTVASLKQLGLVEKRLRLTGTGKDLLSA